MLVDLHAMRQLGCGVKNRIETMLCKDAPDELAIAEVALNAAETIQFVLVPFQVDIDYCMSLAQKPVLENAAKETRAACDKKM